MSKRSRTDFEGGSLGKADGSRQIKRVRKDDKNKRASSIPLSTSKSSSTNNNNNNGSSSDFECPVCYEEFSGHIFQCQEGHLLCDSCRPKFERCPTCRISLSSNIRNRILEQIVCSKNNNLSNVDIQKINEKNKIDKDNNNNNNIKEKYECCLCFNSFKSSDSLNKHYDICDFRKIDCPFLDCQWNGKYKDWAKHAKDDHHTCIGSIQSISHNHHNHNDKKNKKKKKNSKKGNQYTFNHAIKFPKDTFSVK